MTDRQDDPSARLEATFSRIAAERMAGLPILNPALAVAAVGFRPWQDYWLGVLVTPWFLNLVACPTGADEAADLSERVLALPSGNYEFAAAHEDGLGLYFACPLISPMSQFASQADVMAVAEEIAKRVFVAPAKPAPPAKDEPDQGRRGFFRALIPGAKQA
ncbi:[NiFe]-hydrogenase assembly chaperone HybE [Parasulfuritortus cantonensis]|nr:[NiFe]-hydrogenase assembly chaperone HybE [Parasulfuritortus cantonensis]